MSNKERASAGHYAFREEGEEHSFTLAEALYEALKSAGYVHSKMGFAEMICPPNAEVELEIRGKNHAGQRLSPIRYKTDVIADAPRVARVEAQPEPTT